MSEVKVRFPWLLVVPRDERTIGVFTSLQPVDGSIRPMGCVLSAILGSSSSTTGLEVFFPQKTEGKEEQYPFYLLPTYDRIITINAERTREILYEFGELRATERIQSLPFVHLVEGFPTELEILASPSDIWEKIFHKLGQFKDFSICWIEDDINVLRKAGISPPSRLKGDQFNLSDKSRGEVVFISTLDNDDGKVAWNCDKSAVWSIDESRNWQNQIVTKLREILEKTRTDGGFSIFIIDLYFGSGKNISILGDNPIDIIRKEEFGEKEIHPLIISCTGSKSPYLISRTKAIGADFVIFKSAYGTGHGEIMRGGEETGLFYLLGAIYWPLSMLVHTCEKLKKILEKVDRRRGIDTVDLTASIRKLKEETDMLYPRHYAVFWEGWSKNLSVTLRKWEIALSKGNMVSGVKESFINDLKYCLEQAHYSG